MGKAWHKLAIMTGGGALGKVGFRIGDVLAIALVIMLAAAVFLCFLPGRRNEPGAVEIYQDGKLIRTLSLDEDVEISVDGEYHNTVTVCGGKVAITESDCPGEDCVACGWASSSGKSIVCLPNGVEIRIVADSGNVDFVVG
jgi:hypothetical protein